MRVILKMHSGNRLTHPPSERKLATWQVKKAQLSVELEEIFTSGQKLVKKNEFLKGLHCHNWTSQEKQLAAQQSAIRRNASCKAVGIVYSKNADCYVIYIFEVGSQESHVSDSWNCIPTRSSPSQLNNFLQDTNHTLNSAVPLSSAAVFIR